MRPYIATWASAVILALLLSDALALVSACAARRHVAALCDLAGYAEWMYTLDRSMVRKPLVLRCSAISLGGCDCGFQSWHAILQFGFLLASAVWPGEPQVRSQPECILH